MTKNFLEINNVDFNIGGITKVKNVSFSIQNEGVTSLILTVVLSLMQVNQMA